MSPLLKSGELYYFSPSPEHSLCNQIVSVQEAQLSYCLMSNCDV